ncbi:MFS transporter [Nocardioides lianchengensis]|uniref:Transmembrane secretion effector n=1 Tax=Nocardioides lianchengensis TaxID=1045774 RepID=A0A1G6LC40_9ACTN|nr:MFS transporter [Nocardioides lianchengensis]NYG12607.1 MFS family permease [Nocardioides lianchengensis]SDC40774.1 Transmembrane secretion effector [Nocardioides lianchengensis]
MSRLRGLVADTRPLQEPHFRRLWLANIVTVIGAQLTVVAVPAQIYADTGSSAYVGLTGLFGLVPLVVFGLYGGALADHFDRRSILVVTTLGLIGTSGLFFVQAALGSTNVWLLLSLFAVQQAFFAVNQPTRSALLPRLVRTELLPAANALNTTVFQAGAIAGPLLAGVLIPFVGFAWLYLVDTVTLFATLSAVVRLPRFGAIATGAAPGVRAVIDGFAYLRHQPVLLMSFVVDLIAMVFGMPRALFPEIAHLDFGGPDEGGLVFALLFAAIPAGAVIGGVLSGWVSHVDRQGRAVIVCILLWGLAMVGFGLAVGLADRWRGPTLVAALAMLVVGGAADMASSAFRSSMLLAAATDEMRGRLQGVFIVVVAGGPRIADVLHGASAAAVGTAAAAAGGGVLVVVGTVVAALVVPSFVRYRITRTPA